MFPWLNCCKHGNCKPAEQNITEITATKVKIKLGKITGKLVFRKTVICPKDKRLCITDHDMILSIWAYKEIQRSISRRGCLKKEAGQTKKQRPAARKRLVFAVQLKYEKTICTKGL